LTNRRDVKEYARLIFGILKQLSPRDATLSHCMNVFRGSKAKDLKNSSHHLLKEYGVGMYINNVSTIG
jgi:hypothetical protein